MRKNQQLVAHLAAVTKPIINLMIQIEAIQPSHWYQVKAIYEEGIHIGNATFEATPPAWEMWDKGHLKECRIIAREGNSFLG